MTGAILRILLVEDDEMIGAAIEMALRDVTWICEWVRNGRDALHLLGVQEYELVILDLGLPKVDGMTVLRKVRAARLAVPVMVVTARDALDDRLIGLEAGADDYLVKPFAVVELIARARAVVRRSGGHAQGVLRAGRLELDPAAREARLDGTTKVLPMREFALLHALVLRPGAILSKAELEERIYEGRDHVESNAVEFLIHGIRKKLGASVIRNVRGVGWMVPKGE